MSYNVVFIFSENNSYLGKFEMYVFFSRVSIKNKCQKIWLGGWGRRQVRENCSTYLSINDTYVLLGDSGTAHRKTEKQGKS